MATSMSHSTYDDEDEDDDDEVDDREDPDPSDQDASDDEDEDTLPCPFCGKPVYEGADVCPYCRNFITFDTPGRSRKRWALIGGVLALVAAIMAYVAFTVRGANP